LHEWEEETTMDSVTSYPQPRAPHALEWAALSFLTVGSLFPVLGWLVGLALVWGSSVWSRQDKIRATLVMPLGAGFYAVLLLTGGIVWGNSAGRWVSAVPLAALCAVSLWTAARLAEPLRRS
jgi:hypothetical protein